MSDNISNETDAEPKDINIPIYLKIVDFFFGINNEERIKLRKLKKTKKELKKLKYNFYVHKKNQITPALGDYFYNIYKLSQNFTKHINTRDFSKSIKTFLIENSQSKEQIEIKNKLKKENVEESIGLSKNLKVTVGEIQKTSSLFFKSFDSQSVQTINLTYNQIADLSNLINFDWYFLLHKFDPVISEGNFNYKPNFEFLDGQYIIDELVSLSDYINSLSFNKRWNNVFKYVDQASTEDIKLSDLLKKLIKLLKILKEGEYLTKINQLILKNPDFKPKTFASKSKITQEYIYTFQMEIKTTIKTAINQLKKSKIHNLLLSIFETTAIIRLKNYSAKFDAILLDKGVRRFTYIEPLNYLKAFLLDFCKGIIKPRVDFFIIKGEWETAVHSQEYTALLEKINFYSDKIIEFDNSCGDTGAYGKQLKNLLLGAKHNQKSSNLAKRTVIKIESEAYLLLIENIKFFILLGKKLQELIIEINRPIPTFIHNVHKIRWDFPNNPQEVFPDIYKKLYNFIILLKTYVKEDTTKPK